MIRTSRVYLDYNASAPLRAVAREAAVKALEAGPSNASSVHQDGRRGRAAIEDARESIARDLGARSRDLVFTSSATEANNLAIRGALHGAGLGPESRVLCSSTEHPSVLAPLARLARRTACLFAQIPVTPTGALGADAFMALLDRPPAFISLIAANNETGVVADIEKWGRIARQAGAIVHVDATQWFGRLPLNVTEFEADLITLSSHKIGGPQGAGALWVRGGIHVDAQTVGGHQERDRRAGTENIAAIAGFAAASREAQRNLIAEGTRIRQLRSELLAGLRDIDAGVVVHGEGTDHLPNTLNVAFPSVSGETFLMGMDLENVSISSGSACTAGSLDPSHVLGAMGIPEGQARRAVRFSLGYATTQDEISRAIVATEKVVRRGRKEAP